MMKRPIAGLAALLMMMQPGLATAQGGDKAPLTAAETDPVALGWMQGTPPPSDKIVQLRDGSAGRFPQIRWAYSHWRELAPTVAILRGDARVTALPKSARTDIDAILFTPIGGGAPISWEQSLAANYTDGILILHRGHIVYERYFGALGPDGQHIAMSMTKSFTGTLAAMLVQEGRLDRDALVTRYIPELAGSGFGDATVGQVMDMTTGLDYDEVYTDSNAAFYQYAVAGGFAPRPAGYQGPGSIYAFLATIKKRGEHGGKFAYRTINTDVLGWIIQRVSGKSFAQLLSERFWTRLGMEQDAYIHVDSAGTAAVGGGMSLGLRDLARFGEMLRLGGRYNGQQIVPAAVIADIRKGGDKDHFAQAGYSTLPGWSYRDQWWVSHNADGAFMARGVHGQALYIDPKAEMVIARFASHHIAGNAGIDPMSLPAYQAVADHLMRKAR